MRLTDLTLEQLRERCTSARAGFAVVDVADNAAARYWAGRIAVAVGWPQEVHRFPHRIALSS